MYESSAMPHFLPAAACAGIILTASCTPGTEEGLDQDPPEQSNYPLAEVSFLDDDLLNVVSRLPKGTKEDAADYAECAAADAAIAGDHRYLRQIRTQLSHPFGSAVADSVYLISVNKPDGSQVLVASEILSDCSDAAEATLRGEDG